MTRRDYTIRDIHMALDGEMPEDERAAFEEWLAAHPDMLALNNRFLADAAELRSAFEPVLGEPVPERLTTTVTHAVATTSEPARGAPSGARWWRAAAAAVILLAGIGAGYYVGRTHEEFADESTEAVVDRAIRAHAMFAAEKLHVVEVGADQKEHLLGWLSKRVGLQLVAPNLTASGYELVGGRLLPAGSHAAAQFMYQDRAGSRISLYVTSDIKSAESGFRLYEENGARSYYWLDGGYCFALTGTIEEKNLLEMANVAYRQVLDKSEM